MKWISRLFWPIVFITAALFATDGQTVWGIVGVVLSLAIALWQHFAGERASDAQESFNQTQARMMLKQGMGNVYSEAVLHDIQNGQVASGEQIIKALQIDPNDKFALIALSVTRALNISTRMGHGERANQDSINAVRRICRKGRKLYPEESLFASALGVLADCEGFHELARLWFQKAGDLSIAGDPSWRLSMATSFAMSHDFEEAYKQIEQAIQGGVSAWLAEFYMGRALCSLGKYGEALKFLHLARERKFHPDILLWLRVANINVGNAGQAVLYGWLLTIALLAREPINGLRSLGATVLFSLGIGISKVGRLLFFVLAPVVGHRPLLIRILKPDNVELTMSGELLAQQHFRAADDICRVGLRAIPDSFKLLCQLAGSLAMQGRREEALVEIDKALLLYPDNPILTWNRKQIATQTDLRVRFLGKNEEIPPV